MVDSGGTITSMNDDVIFSLDYCFFSFQMQSKLKTRRVNDKGQMQQEEERVRKMWQQEEYEKDESERKEHKKIGLTNWQLCMMEKQTV